LRQVTDATDERRNETDLPIWSPNGCHVASCRFLATEAQSTGTDGIAVTTPTKAEGTATSRITFLGYSVREYLVNSMEQCLSEAGSHSAGQEIPVFYRTRSFITVFIEPATVPYPEPDESSP